jgi:hypothetical protein
MLWLLLPSNGLYRGGRMRLLGWINVALPAPETGFGTQPLVASGTAPLEINNV